MLVKFILEIATNASDSKSMRLRLVIQQLLIKLTPITIATHPTVNCHKIITFSCLFLRLHRSRRKGVFIFHKASIFHRLLLLHWCSLLKVLGSDVSTCLYLLLRRKDMNRLSIWRTSDQCLAYLYLILHRSL